MSKQSNLCFFGKEIQPLMNSNILESVFAFISVHSRFDSFWWRLVMVLCHQDPSWMTASIKLLSSVGLFLSVGSFALPKPLTRQAVAKRPSAGYGIQHIAMLLCASSISRVALLSKAHSATACRAVSFVHQAVIGYVIIYRGKEHRP